MNKNVMLSFDLDGVLANFDKRVIDLTGVTANQLDRHDQLWPALNQHPTFFADLEPYHDVVQYARYLNELGVQIRVITGRPRKDSFPTATADKVFWARQHLGQHVDVIVCLARDKHKHMKVGVLDILIDDRMDNVHNWRLAGGTAIFHQNYSDTRIQLSTLLNLDN